MTRGRNKTPEIIICIMITVMIATGTFLIRGEKAFAATTNYNVWIGGTRITSANCKSNNTWQYDEATRTLTLNGYSYSGTGHKGELDEELYNAPVFTSGKLNIVLKGTNTVTSKYEAGSDYTSVGIIAMKDIVISGNGTLKATGGANPEYESFGICSYNGGIEIKSGIVTATGGQGESSYGVNCENNTLTIKGGTLTAAAGKAYSSYGINCTEMCVEAGTVKATGNIIVGGDEDSKSIGIYAMIGLSISGGTVTANGGTASTGASCGINAELNMKGGSLTATGGSAKIMSAGFVSTRESNNYIISGTASLTGGACTAGSYGAATDDEDEMSEDPDIYMGECILAISGTAEVTAKGNTAASNTLFNYTYDPNAEETDYYKLCGEYYVYDDHYAPVVTASTAFSGASPKVYTAPSPFDDLYTKNKYVNIRPAVMPSSISLSQTLIRTGSIGYETRIDVTYYPENTEIKGVVWMSEETDIAYVDQEGKVSVRSNGETTLTAAVGTAKATCKVVCDPDEFISYIFFEYDSETPWIHDINDELVPDVRIYPSRFSDTKLLWTSSDESIATVDQNGVVKGRKNGQVTITAKDPEGEAKATCDVRVHLTRDVSKMEVDGIKDSYKYTGSPLRITDYDVEGLVENRDYTVKCDNPMFPGDSTITITGKGKYYGTKVITCRIEFDRSAVLVEGSCGDGLNWYITKGYKLLIMGSGSMYDYTAVGTADEAPWNDYTNGIDGIWIQNGCTRIGTNAFSDLSNLNLHYLVLPDTLTEIGDRAFSGVKGTIYGSVPFSLPDSLKTIGDHAFSRSTMLDIIFIPESVTKIGNGAFEGCEGLSGVKVGEGVREIAPYTFAYCKDLEIVVLPDGLQTIGENAFRFCPVLEDIDIPAGVTSIASSAFAKCSGLEEVLFYGSKAPAVSDDAFEGCSSELILMKPSGSTGWDQDSLSGFKIYDAHEHDARDVDLTPATFGHQGREVVRCSVCGKKRSSETYARIKSAVLDTLEYVYSGKECRPGVLISDVKGNKLEEEKDYRVEYIDAVNAGAATARVIFVGKYEGEKDLGFVITPADVSELALKLSRKSFICNGKVKRPKVTVEGCTTADYDIVWSSKSSKKIGRYYVTVSGKGNYSGTVKAEYTIVPPRTKLRKAAAGKKSAKVTWKKLSRKLAGQRITGYEIQYSTSKKFKRSSKVTKTVRVKGWKKTSKKIKKLKKGKKYYFRVRTYRTVNKKKYYSAWSKARKARIR